MESEQHHYELRSRSRSRSHTPMVPNRPLLESELSDHHYDLRNKSRERSHTPGEIKSSRGSRTLTGSTSKMHEKNMETIDESKEGSLTESMTDNQSTKSESSTVTTRKVERRSERQKAKRQMLVNGQNESKEEIDKKSERKRKSITPRRILTSDYSSEEGEREDPPSRPGSAYKIYKQAGEWWNVFPKTDYTYSQTSQCRYEIAPGILAMPNMSRRSIHSNGSEDNAIHQISHRNLSQTSQKVTESEISDLTDGVDLDETGSLSQLSRDHSYDILHTRTLDPASKSSLYKKTHIEQYTTHREIIYAEPGNSINRQRYFSWSDTPSRFAESHKYSASQVDSDAELDETFSVKVEKRWKIVQWFIYLTSLVNLWFRKIIEFVKFKTDRRRQYYNAQAYRTYNGSRWNTLWTSLDRYSHKTYFFFVRILVFDAWLLSHVTGIRKWLQEKSPKILWIAFLPLLFLIGYWCVSQGLSLLPSIKTASETVTEKLSHNAQWNAHKTKNDEARFNNNDLVSRIKILETEQTYQMEYLLNVSQVLEDRKQSDTTFQKEYNDKIIDMEHKISSSELNNAVYNELKVIKYEFEKLRELYAELKSCCNANAERATDQNIEKHIEKILFSYFPSAISKEDLTKITQNLYPSYMKKDQGLSNNDADNANAHVSDEYVRKIVKEVLQIYDADKTGQVDYALESAGGQIISTRCTQRYDIKSRAFSLFGFTLFYESNNPRTVIQGNIIQPGACWAFQDFPGYLLIQLRSIIYVTGFTLEHVSKLVLPNENMSSAPKKFNVWGLADENDLEPVKFGDYEFTYTGESLQYFPVQNVKINRPYEYIELRIHSNHGQLEYTCLYRFRVHGRPA